MSRIGMLLAEGSIIADTLVIEAQNTAWKLYKGDVGADFRDVRAKIKRYNDALLSDMKTLERKHILYHLGDEILMERHGSVRGNEMIIGNMRYKQVVIPENIGLLPNTVKLLEEFEKHGGVIVTADEIMPNPITEENDLTYTKRQFEDFDIHYFVNSTDSPIYATFNRGNLALDIVTGEAYDFYGDHSFAPTESLVIIDTHEPRARRKEAKHTELLSLLGEWQVKDATYNSITLDRCDYYFDGELIAKNGYVLDILPRINQKRRAVDLTQIYRFSAEAIPNPLFLCIETPEIFNITLNGKQVENKVVGDFIDKSFKLLDISSSVDLGENELVIKSTIKQSDATYEHLSKSWKFESMRNSLSYDMEIEPIYIVGNFGTRLISEMNTFEKASYRITKLPVISKRPTTVTAEALDLSGYAEFAGTLTLSRTFDIDNTNKRVKLFGVGMNSVHLSINGKRVATKMFAPYEVDISDYLMKGENIFELKIINNLRNMQGPHHLNAGDTAGIGPSNFFRESNVFCHSDSKGEDCHDVLEQFNDDIALVHFGLRD